MENPSPFLVELTEDGSPTACLGRGAERMHNQKGALGETVHVYGPVLRWAVAQAQGGRLLSVGLGVGYVEMLAAAYAVAARGAPLCIRSFESLPALRTRWMQWVEDAAPNLSPYSTVQSLVARSVGVCPLALKKEIKQAYAGRRWVLEGSLGPSTPWPQDGGAHGVAFDAFSRHTSPELWDQATLIPLLEEGLAPDSIFASYCATGALKRTLSAAGFAGHPRRGFGGKRESTLAWRGAKARAYADSL